MLDARAGPVFGLYNGSRLGCARGGPQGFCRPAAQAASSTGPAPVAGGQDTSANTRASSAFTLNSTLWPLMFVTEFVLFLNTGPLNAAIVNAVSAPIRATALAVNIFIIHILGDVPSPTMMGWVADRHSLQTAFVLPVIAMVLSAAILFYGMRFAPPLRIDHESGGAVSASSSAE